MNIPSRTFFLLSLPLLLAGCIDECYDKYSVSQMPIEQADIEKSRGTPIIDLNQEGDLSRFGVLIDMLNAAGETSAEDNKSTSNEFILDAPEKRKMWESIMDELESLSLEQNGETSNIIKYKDDLYLLMAIHGPGCVR